MSIGRVPTEIFGVSEFFYRKFVKKNFRGRGPQKSTFLGLFSKIDVRNFCQRGKNVFFKLPIFLKNRGNGGVFLGVRPKIFFTKTDQYSAACVKKLEWSGANSLIFTASYECKTIVGARYTCIMELHWLQHGNFLSLQFLEFYQAKLK